MGIGVGAACPVLLSAIGTNNNGRRTALIFLLNDLFGMIFWSVAFYSIHAAVHFSFMDIKMGAVQIALLNTVFRTEDDLHIYQLSFLFPEFSDIFPANSVPLRKKPEKYFSLLFSPCRSWLYGSG